MNQLETLLKQGTLNRGTHDSVIRRVKAHNEVSPNVLPMFESAYYKIRKGRGCLEGDIDLLQMLYDYEALQDVAYWQEVPFANATLLLHEMKSMDNDGNHSKALKQLKKSKHMITNYTPYQFVDCLYCFGVDKRKDGTFVLRHEQID